MYKHKPKEKSWSTAQLFHVYLNEMRFPICGLRHVFAVVGYKWVRIFVPFHNVKFKVNRSIWNKMDVKQLEGEI